jgi:hypothetical protein
VMQYGYSDAAWGTAKAEATRLLREVAHGGSLIAYSVLASQIVAIPFAPRDQRFFYLLREISAEEFAAGRGMLTALVVHQAGDFRPGPGFFDLAHTLGLDTSDTDRLWAEQVKVVQSYWSARRLADPPAC